MTPLDYVYVYIAISLFVNIWMVTKIQELTAHVNILNTQNRELSKMIALATKDIQEE